jgi:hypothetical protein
MAGKKKQLGNGLDEIGKTSKGANVAVKIVKGVGFVLEALLGLD